MGAVVVFKRSLYLDNVDGLSEDEIVEKAIALWNEEMDLGDILMNEDHVVSVEFEEGV